MALVQEDQNFELFFQLQNNFNQLISRENLLQKSNILNILNKDQIISRIPFQIDNLI